MLTRLLVAAAALAAAMPAMAADFTPTPPSFYPPPAIPAFTWTGFYAGLQAGYAFGADHIYGTTANGGSAYQLTNPDGFIGGGHIGYNFSISSVPFISGLGSGLFAGGLVIGVEGDVDGSNVRSIAGIGDGLYSSLRTPVQGSARGRIGFGIDRALFYATGGAAFADMQTTTLARGAFASGSSEATGYTVGGGIEYSVTPQWSVRAEYRYTDFGSVYSATANGDAIHHDDAMQRAQLGFSYKFGDSTPSLPVPVNY